MAERKIRVLIAKPGLSPEGDSVPLPDLPLRLRRQSLLPKEVRHGGA